MLHLVDVRFGIGQIFSEDIKSPHLAVHQSVHHLGNHEADIIRQLRGLPMRLQGFLDFSHIFIDGHCLITGKHIGQGAHVAGALDIVLAAQRVDTAHLHAHVAQKHLQVGGGHDVVPATGVLGDSQGVAEHTCFTEASRRATSRILSASIPQMSTTFPADSL